MESNNFEKFVLREYKTHRSASEAFRDAEYASPITYFESDLSRSLRIFTDVGLYFLIVFIFAVLAYYFFEAVTK